MMPLKKFEEFIASGAVKKQRQDAGRAGSLIKESESKKEFLKKLMKSMPFGEVNPNYIIETCYDILLETIRAKMFMDGFNSNNSHEAEVSYMRNLGFPEQDVRFINELRYFRNGIKYYGRILDKEYAKRVLDFFEATYPKLRRLV